MEADPAIEARYRDDLTRHGQRYPLTCDHGVVVNFGDACPDCKQLAPDERPLPRAERAKYINCAKVVRDAATILDEIALEVRDAGNLLGKLQSVTRLLDEIADEIASVGW